MQLKDTLHKAGYTERDLYERMIKKYCVSYQQLNRYCRSIHSNCMNPLVWSGIKEILKEMRVEWNG